MDTIFLHGLKAETLIGVYDWERRQRQTLVLDLTLGTDFAAAAASDNIADTIHYAEVAEVLRQNLAEQQFLLLEALAEHVAALILTDFGARWVRVRVVKPGILPQVASVGVEIERHAQSSGDA
ncbi:dihydroneopterin aldolase [Neisseria sp. HSC-16F19]|nr:dihydroneopterin aldolase [Neisseria sp. HSC-16F19]MCP2040193.1 dihydroneopterin aldolase [Neisseria sp. HSC-16F19]